VCNRHRVPGGDCHDGLWGQVAVWPSRLVRVARGARDARALSPLVAAGSHDFHEMRGGRGRSGTAHCAVVRSLLFCSGYICSGYICAGSG
jgi:hypothetical protein